MHRTRSGPFKLLLEETPKRFDFKRVLEKKMQSTSLFSMLHPQIADIIAYPSCCPRNVPLSTRAKGDHQASQAPVWHAPRRPRSAAHQQTPRRLVTTTGGPKIFDIVNI